MSTEQAELRRRWRLVLGRYADQDGARLGAALDAADRRRDRLLGYLYDREYQDRQTGADGDRSERQGGRGPRPERLNAPRWLAGVRELFPRTTSETLQRQALQRYGLDELLTDPEVLSQTAPSIELVRTLISCRSLLPPEAMAAARKIIRQVVEQLERRLTQKVRNAITGPRRRGRHGGRPSLANLDWATTLRRNLKHYHRASDSLVLERLYFWQRDKNKLRWDVIILVDQSGSMLDSVIHSAVLAAIFCGLRTLRTRLVLFDTEVVDLSDKIGDPVEVLLGVQLGGGTDIARAVQYAAGKVTAPRQTLLVLISDFYEGGDPTPLLAAVQRLHAGGVKLLGLAALDRRAEPDYDRRLAQRLADRGMEIGAMTPEQLAEWVGGIIH